MNLARANTERNIETCALLTGFIENEILVINTLIFPVQEATADTCTALEEEKVMTVQIEWGLMTMGWM